MLKSIISALPRDIEIEKYEQRLIKKGMTYSVRLSRIPMVSEIQEMVVKMPSLGAGSTFQQDGVNLKWIDVNYTKRNKFLIAPTCDCLGDFGHTNVWGNPYLKFGVTCRLPRGHEGSHEGKFQLSIVPTSEPYGINIDRTSVELGTSEAIVRWKMK